MANATAVDVVVKRPGVCLELTHEEAKALFIVLSRVGGDPNTSPRKDTQSVYDALETLNRDGLKYDTPEYNRLTRLLDGHLRFEEN